MDWIETIRVFHRTAQYTSAVRNCCEKYSVGMSLIERHTSNGLHVRIIIIWLEYKFDLNQCVFSLNSFTVGPVDGYYHLLSATIQFLLSCWPFLCRLKSVCPSVNQFPFAYTPIVNNWNEMHITVHFTVAASSCNSSSVISHQ